MLIVHRHWVLLTMVMESCGDGVVKAVRCARVRGAITQPRRGDPYSQCKDTTFCPVGQTVVGECRTFGELFS